MDKSTKKVLTILAITVGLCTFMVLGQNVPQRPQRPQQAQPRCEEMQKLFKQIQDHRTGCEVCKTNMPFGGRDMGGQGGPGGGRGQGGPRQ